MSELPDPLEDFLQHPPTLDADAALRQTLARQTAAMMPRARRRYWPMTVAIAASIAVTLVSTYFILRYINVEEPVKNDFVERQIDAPPPHEKPKLPVDEPKPPLVAKPIQPRELEWT